MNYFRKTTQHSNSNRDAGFSLIETIMAVALVSISALGITKGIEYARSAQKDAALKSSSGKFKDAFRAAIADRARDFIEDSCSGAKYGYLAQGSQTTGGGNGGGGTGASYSNETPVSRAFSSMAMASDSNLGGGMTFTTAPTNVADVFKAAARRCGNPKPSSSQSSGRGFVGNGEYAHFCMNLLVKPENRKAGSTDNFWSMDGAFAEILIVPVNLTTDEPILCEDARSSSQGYKVVYSIFGSYKDPSSGTTAPLKGIRSNGLFFGAIKSSTKPSDNGS